VAVVIAAGLTAPLGGSAGRNAGPVRALFAVGGSGLPSFRSSRVRVGVVELFGFTEGGYRTPIVLAIVAEASAAVFLLIFLAAAGTGVPRAAR